ncbi:MAG: pyridoxal phosphate-dependent aminotransferase [Dehalococcoidia bacterium]|nr:pyridoxal phosphate-dependent aminotransferase [Dehalococcoidia bacterium]
MKQDYLLPSPPAPAIREAMAKAVQRKEKGLAVFDFSSGNIGNLMVSQHVFSHMDVSVTDDVLPELKPVVEGMRDGLIASYYPAPAGVAYSPTGGTDPIRALVARYYRELHGVPIEDTASDRVIVTAGGQQAMTAALRSIKPGTRVLVPQWEYGPASGVIRAHGCEEVRVGMKDDLSIDMEDFRRKATKAAVCYVSMPNNPTGYMSAEQLREMTRIMVENDGGLVWDAPYLFTLLRLDGTVSSYDAKMLQETLNTLREIGEQYYPHLCILSSLSKTCLIAGLRFGFAYASAQWIDNMEAIIGRENLSSPTPSFITGKEVLKRFLDKPTSYAWVCRVLANRLNILIREMGDHLLLPGNGLFGALYVLIKTGDQPCKPFADRLIEQSGIVTVPCNQFYGGEAHAVRLSLVSVPWTEDEAGWIASVAALKAALA